MKCVVFYRGWEYDCCGEDFAIGETLTQYGNLPHDDCLEICGRKIDYFLFTHDGLNDEIYFEIEGTIIKIELVYEKYEINNNKNDILIDSKIIEVKNSKDFKIIDDFHFEGFLITLEAKHINKCDEPW